MSQVSKNELPGEYFLSKFSKTWELKINFVGPSVDINKH